MPWLLGDTYNVSIGQGDLLLTPIQLLDYIGAIANGGDIYRPFLNASSTPAVAEDLTSYLPQIQQVQEGMREGVAAPKGTSYTLHNLPFSVCAKTGSAQVQNNTQENALFVGYAPCNNPQIALLILIENSRAGEFERRSGGGRCPQLVLQEQDEIAGSIRTVLRGRRPVCTVRKCVPDLLVIRQEGL